MNPISEPDATRAIDLSNPSIEVAEQEMQSKPLSKAFEQPSQSNPTTRNAGVGPKTRVSGHPRHALVIGNANYEVGALRNPLNDARAMERSLTQLGFKVKRLENLTERQMSEAVSSFCYDLPEESLAFFFFAGHGMQIDKNNYLIPVDAFLKSEADVKHNTLSLDYVLDSLAVSRSIARCVVLDCCQDNPFARGLRVHRGQVERGFAETRGGSNRENMVICHATHAGLTALDGKGNNSPYTKALIEMMSKRPDGGLLLNDVIFDTGTALYEATGQRPWLNIDVAMPKVYLLPPVATQMASVDSNRPKSPTDKGTYPIEDLGSIQMSPKSLDSDESSDHAMNCVDLLRQASTYENNGSYQDALDICSTILELDRATTFDKRSARLKRASICLTRGRIEDFKIALLDKLACGEKHMRIAVRVQESDLKDGSRVLGTIRRNQVATVNQINGDWIWVEAVQGDSSRRGWTKLTSFVEPKKIVAEPSIVSSMPAKPATNSSPNHSFPTPAAYPSQTTYPSQQQALQPSNTDSVPTNPVTSYSATPYSSLPNQNVSISPTPSSVQTTSPQSPYATQSTTRSTYQPQPTYQQQQSTYQPRSSYSSTPQPQTQRITNQYQSPRQSSLGTSGSSSNARNMTLGQSQRLIDRNNAQRWKPGANQDAITRQNQQIRQQRQLRVQDFFGR